MSPGYRRTRGPVCVSEHNRVVDVRLSGCYRQCWCHDLHLARRGRWRSPRQGGLLPQFISSLCNTNNEFTALALHSISLEQHSLPPLSMQSVSRRLHREPKRTAGRQRLGALLKTTFMKGYEPVFFYSYNTLSLLINFLIRNVKNATHKAAQFEI